MLYYVFGAVIILCLISFRVNYELRLSCCYSIVCCVRFSAGTKT